MEYITLQLGVMPTNTYIFFDEKTKNTVIFDPAANSERILRVLNKNSLNLKYIFLTHGHGDHITAVNEIRAATDAKLVSTLKDIDLLDNYKNNYSYAIFGEKYEVTAAPEIILNDEDIICLDSMYFQCIHTPGHTAGSCVYLTNDIMISGDTIFYNGIGRTDLYSGSFEEIKKSIERIFTFKTNYTILPGHGNFTTLFYEKCNYSSSNAPV